MGPGRRRRLRATRRRRRTTATGKLRRRTKTTPWPCGSVDGEGAQRRPGDGLPRRHAAASRRSSSPSASFEWSVGDADRLQRLGRRRRGRATARRPASTGSRASPTAPTRPAGACHAHPLQAFPGFGGGSLIAPDHDYPSHIELTLTRGRLPRPRGASKASELDPRDGRPGDRLRSARGDAHRRPARRNRRRSP